MEQPTPQPSIPEAFFEHRHLFDEPWIDKWIFPNPFVIALARPLRPAGIELTDFSFNKDASNFGENYLNIAIRKFNAAVRVGIDGTGVGRGKGYGLGPRSPSAAARRQRSFDMELTAMGGRSA